MGSARVAKAAAAVSLRESLTSFSALMLRMRLTCHLLYFTFYNGHYFFPLKRCFDFLAFPLKAPDAQLHRFRLNCMSNRCCGNSLSQHERFQGPNLRALTVEGSKSSRLFGLTFSVFLIENVDCVNR